MSSEPKADGGVPDREGGMWSRREVVKAAAVAAATAPVLGACGTTGTLRREWMGPVVGRGTLRVGLVGCGGRGTGAARQALAADGGAVLVAMADVFPERMDECVARLTTAVGETGSQRVQVPPERRYAGFDGYQRVIDSGVDVVLLATPPGFRPAHFKAAVEAGKHIFAEKPVAVDAPGLRSVLESSRAAKAKGLNVVSGFCWRYAEAERATFARINDGAIGEVVTVHTTYHTNTLAPRPRQAGWSDVEWQLRNWWHFAWLSGDHIVEQAVHSIDKMAWATGDRTPVRCTALGGRAARRGAESGHVFDHFAVVYEYEDGKRCFHTCRQMDGCPSDNTDYVYGTKGSATVNGWVPTHSIRDARGREKWMYEGVRGDMYQNEHNVLFSAIRRGRPVNDGEFMCRSTMMGIMGRMSAYTGQTVTWEGAMGSKEELVPRELAMGMEMGVPAVAVPGRTKLV